MRFWALCVCLLTSVLFNTVAKATDVRVAVAANFTPAAKEIAQAFEDKTGLKVRLSFGSTGKLYAQIIHGAPFDVFLAADAARPLRLEQEGHSVMGSRKTYATGSLVLWSPDETRIQEDLGATLKRAFNKLAIANPKTAPYGIAALEVLKAKGVYDQVQDQLVMGNNIAQTLQFVATGNVEMGFIAASQAAQMTGGSRWKVPTSLHAPLDQEAVLLKRAQNKEAAQKFLTFLDGPEARAIKARYLYLYGS